jgi:steroid delta-isomerase-like uncharacterized protein
MSEQNKTVARRAIEEMFSGGNLGLAEELYSPEFVNHDPADDEDAHGIDGIRARVEGYRAAFPDLNVTVEDILGEGDRVCTRWIARGTHEGDLEGLPATGRTMQIDGMSIDRIEDGKIVETWDNWDTIGMMRQLGAIPEEQAAAS